MNFFPFLKLKGRDSLNVLNGGSLIVVFQSNELRFLCRLGITLSGLSVCPSVCV